MAARGPGKTSAVQVGTQMKRPNGATPQARATDARWKDADRRQEQHDAKRRLILNQAARMFSDHGFHETTIENIAAALNVTKPTIYYYIDSKEDILYQIARTALDDFDADLINVGGSTIKAIDRLEHFFNLYVRMILSDAGVCMALVTDRSLNPDYRRKLRMLKKEFELRVRSIVADGAIDGTIVVENPRFFANAIFGAYNWMPQWFSGNGAASPEEAGTAFFQLFRRAAQPSRRNG